MPIIVVTAKCRNEKRTDEPKGVHLFFIGKMHFWRAFLPVRWWKEQRVFVTMINKEGFAWIWGKISQRQERMLA